MKALIIIVSCLLLAIAFRAAELLKGRKVNSVGAKSNSMSKDMPRININDETQLKEALSHYKNLAD